MIAKMLRNCSVMSEKHEETFGSQKHGYCGKYIVEPLFLSNIN